MEIWKKMWVGVFSEHSVISRLPAWCLVFLSDVRRSRFNKTEGKDRSRRARVTSRLRTVPRRRANQSCPPAVTWPWRHRRHRWLLGRRVVGVAAGVSRGRHCVVIISFIIVITILTTSSSSRQWRQRTDADDVIRLTKHCSSVVAVRAGKLDCPSALLTVSLFVTRLLVVADITSGHSSRQRHRRLPRRLLSCRLRLRSNRPTVSVTCSRCRSM